MSSCPHNPCCAATSKGSMRHGADAKVARAGSHRGRFLPLPSSEPRPLPCELLLALLYCDVCMLCLSRGPYKGPYRRHPLRLAFIVGRLLRLLACPQIRQKCCRADLDLGRGKVLLLFRCLLLRPLPGEVGGRTPSGVGQPLCPITSGSTSGFRLVETHPSADLVGVRRRVC